MNINIFFIFIAALLASIYIFFSPMKLPINKESKTAQLQLSHFTVYNLTTHGVQSVFSGTKGLKYGLKYIVYDVNYTDNSTKSLANITALHGVFKQPIIKLDGNVLYKNISGLIFKSNEATYNQTSKVLRTKGKYILLTLTISSAGFANKLKVVADNFHGNNIKGISTFSGNVKITKGDDELNASNVVIYF